MNKLLIIIIFLTSPVAAQHVDVSITSQILTVTTIHKDTTIVDRRLVTLGTKLDKTALCFHIDYPICFWEMRRLWSADAQMIEILYSSKSITSERYVIRQVRDKTGFSIWFTNIDKGFPHWFMTTKL